MPADILIYALVAAGLIFWLRSVLGTRHGDEPEGSNPLSSDRTATQAPQQPSAFIQADLVAAGEGSLHDHLAPNMAIGNQAAEDGLMKISRADREFSVPHFLNAAQDAFIMIVEAFARGDRDTLKMLLSESLYRAFDDAITAREQNGETSEVEIHAMRRSEILDAQLQNRMAYITVKFVADETNILRNSDGEVTKGHPDYVSETIDIWTFGRDIKSKSPAWLLYETRDEDAADSDHKTVPDGTSA